MWVFQQFTNVIPRTFKPPLTAVLSVVFLLVADDLDVFEDLDFDEPWVEIYCSMPSGSCKLMGSSPFKLSRLSSLSLSLTKTVSSKSMRLSFADMESKLCNFNGQFADCLHNLVRIIVHNYLNPTAKKYHRNQCHSQCQIPESAQTFELISLQRFRETSFSYDQIDQLKSRSDFWLPSFLCKRISAEN